jgi:hypothetical protein
MVQNQTYNGFLDGFFNIHANMSKTDISNYSDSIPREQGLSHFEGVAKRVG